MIDNLTDDELAERVRNFWNQPPSAPSAETPSAPGATTTNTGTNTGTNTWELNLAEFCDLLQHKREGLFKLVNCNKAEDLLRSLLFKAILTKAKNATNATGQLTPIIASTGTPLTGTPLTGTPLTGTPLTGTPLTGTPLTGTPLTGTPLTGTPLTGTPLTGTPNVPNPPSLLVKKTQDDVLQSVPGKPVLTSGDLATLQAKYIQTTGILTPDELNTLLENASEYDLNRVYERVVMENVGDPGASAFTPTPTGSGEATLWVSGKLVWEQLPWETDNTTYNWFNKYLEEGYECLTKTKNAGQKVLKSRSLNRFAKRNQLDTQWLRTIAKKYSWEARLQAHDNTLKKLNLETKRDEQTELKNEHLEMSRTISSMAHQKLIDMFEDGTFEDKPSAVMSIWEKAVRMGRLSTGMFEDKPSAIEVGLTNLNTATELTPEAHTAITGANTGMTGANLNLTGLANLNDPYGQTGSTTVTNNNLNITLETQKKLKDDNNLNAILYVLQESGALPKAAAV